MSSILKAIRKIEDDKRSQGNKAPDLMIDHGQAASKPKTSVAPLVAGIVLGAVVVGALTFVLTSGQRVSQERSIKSTLGPSVAAPVVDPPATKGPVIEKSVAESPPTSMAVPVATSIVKEVTVAPKKVIQAEPQDMKPSPDVTQQDVAPAKPLEVSPAVSTTATLAETEQRTDLVVSEIFYVDDQASSMAVINDLPVMVGTYIGDVLVQAINEDSVIFQASGKSFSIQLQNP